MSTVRAGILLGLMGQMAASQAPTHVIPKAADCAQCVIAYERVARITYGIESAERVINGVAAMDSRGRTYIVGDWRRWQIDVYDSTGLHLKSIGRQGAGPGEFKSIRSLLIGAGDTLRVIDTPNKRRTVISPTTLAVVRIEPWGSFPLAELRPIGGSLFAGANRVYSRRLTGQHRIHVVDDSGRRIAEFDAGADSTKPQPEFALWRTIAPDGSGGVLSGHADHYQLDRWAADGRLIESFTRDVGWFRPMPSSGPRPIEHGGNPYLHAVERDSSGLIWILLRIRDPRWKQALAEVRDESGKPTITSGDDNLYDDSVIEVLDPSKRHIVASQRFDPAFMRFVKPGYVMSASDEPIPSVTIWRLRLNRP